MLEKKIKLHKKKELAQLKRRLRLPAIIAISIAGMLGSGIFVLPGLAISQTGESVWIAYLIAAICIIPAVLSKSELSTAMPDSGGAYVYIERSFGPLFGTIAGIGLWLSLLLKSSFALVGFGAYISVLIDSINIEIEYISLLCLSIIIILNIMGVKKVGKIQLLIVSISLIGLISILFLGINTPEEYKASNPFLTNGTMGLISTIAFVYISYAGVTKIAAIAGEVKNPSRNIPLAMIFSLILISIIYVSITYILAQYVGVTELEGNYYPIYTLSNKIGGGHFSYIICIIAIITLISMANSGVLASSRFPFAMAIDKLLPPSLTTIHKRYLTPINTILLTGLIMSLVILLLDVEKIAKLASGFKVFMFISVNLCVIILRETSVQWYQPEYKSPLYPYIQLFGIISGLILLLYLGLMPLIAIISVGIIGGIIYFIYGKEASRSGVLINYGHIPALFFFFKKRYELKKSKIIEIHNNQDIQRGDRQSPIITLLGNERSTENLLEIALSLTNGKRVKMVDIIEVPDQTALEAINLNSPRSITHKRQAQYIKKRYSSKIDIETLCTHNVSKSIEELSIQNNPEWLILEWNGKAYNGMLVKNPLGWIVSNIHSNFALFIDNGVKYFSKIILAVRYNNIDTKRMIKISSRIAKFYNAELNIIQVVKEDVTRNKKEEMESKISNLSIQLDTPINNIIIASSDEPTKYISEITPEYDLLILGTPKKETWIDMLFGTGKDPIATQANCSVLRLTIK